METLGTYLLDFVLAVILGLFIKYAVPYIKSKITAENLSFIKTWVENLVAAAEQTITGSKMGATRKAWVKTMLEKLGIVADETVDALIESAVLALNSTVNVLTEAIVSGVEEVTNGAVTEEKAKEAVETVTAAVTETASATATTEETVKQEE
jgi:hypothetical protein